MFRLLECTQVIFVTFQEIARKFRQQVKDSTETAIISQSVCLPVSLANLSHPLHFPSLCFAVLGLCSPPVEHFTSLLEF